MKWIHAMVVSLALAGGVSAQSVVVNEFRNAAPDAVELVVIQDNLDMRGMILKDYASSGTTDNGGAFTFTTNDLWSSLPAGAIIVLRRDTTAADITVGSGDYNLDVGLQNTTYFVTGSGTFDIATEDLIQIKSSGSGQAGSTGAIHTLATDGAGALYTSSPSPKLKASTGDTGSGESVEAGNSTQTLADYDGTDATGDDATGSIGTWNNANNEAYILSLRGGGGGPSTNVQFTASSGSVGEDGVSFTVTVYKTIADGNVSGQLTLGGTAATPADYTVDTTNFTLNGATTSATITVSIVDDGDTEIAETVVLTLANIAGGTLGSPGAFTLTITDNDGPSGSGLMISQYTETDVGSTPKGIEVWNNTGSPITFDSSANKLDVKVGVNGAAPSSVATVETGSLAAGDVLVIGTSDMTPDVVEAFNFNGDDAVVLEFGGVVVDMIGVAGTDPGSEWSGSGVSTLNQNIQLKSDITTSDPNGWTDPSLRFETVGVGSILTGFGTPPGGSPVVTTNVQFTGASAVVAESAGTYTVTVTKTVADGNVSGTVTLGGTAATPADFTIDTTNFTMNGATTSATFVVTISDDGDVESSETVTLTLTNVIGGTVASPSVFTLTINDNDAPPSTPEGILAFRFTDGTLDVAHNSNGIAVSAMSLTVGTIETNITTGTYFPNEPYIEETGGWTNPTQTGAKAFQFTVTPEVDVSVTITGVSLRAYATGTGPSAFGVSIDGASVFAADMPDSAIQTVSNSFAPIVKTAAFVVSIEGWTNGSRVSSGTGVFRIDDVVLFGEIGGGVTTTNVSFGASAAAVGEDHGIYVVTVTKSLAEGDVSGTVELGGSASTPGDYTISTTNFTMNGATTSATFNITITDDGSVEGVETITLTLADVTGGTVVSPSVFTLTINDNDVPPPPTFNLWVNELHYDTQGGDVNEGVEIAGAAGTDLAGYSLHFYDGLTNGLGVYIVTNLTGIIDDESNGFGALWFSVSGIQNGHNDPANGGDGFALVYNSTQVVQLLSYEGVFVATNGPAAGMVSTNIGQQESNTTTLPDTTLQLCGTGTNYADFAWSASAAHSRGSLNSCQTIPGGSGFSPEQEAYIITHWGSVGGYTGDGADDDGDGFSNREEFIAVTTPVPPSGSNSFFRASGILSGASRSVIVASATGRLYRLWGSATLFPTQNWVTVDGPTAGTGGSLSLSDSTDTNAASYRLTVELE